MCAINNLRAFGISEAEDLEEQLTALQGSNHDMNAKEPSKSADDAMHDSSSSKHSSVGIVPDAGGAATTAYEQAATGSRSQHSSGEPGQAEVPEDEQRHSVLAHAEAAANDRVLQDRAEPVGSDGSHIRQDWGDHGAKQTAGPSEASSAEPRSQADAKTSLDPTDQHVFADQRPSRDIPPQNASGNGQASHPATELLSKGRTSPQVLPHVFNEAVGVFMNEGGSTAGLPVQRNGDGGEPARARSAKHRQSAGVISEGEEATYAGENVKAEGYDRMPSSDQPKVSNAKAGTVSIEQSKPPKQASQTKEFAVSISGGTANQLKPDMSTLGPAASNRGDTDHSLAEGHERGSTNLGHKCTGAGKEEGPGSGENQMGSRKPKARHYAGHATGLGTKEPAAVPRHDTSAASKRSMNYASLIVFFCMMPFRKDPTRSLTTAGTSSVYDLIKKELLALKVETSTLGMLIKQSAPQSALQEAVRKEAETEAKLVLAADTIRALELRLNALEIVQEQAASMHKLLLQVRLYAKLYLGPSIGRSDVWSTCMWDW